MVTGRNRAIKGALKNIRNNANSIKSDLKKHVLDHKALVILKMVDDISLRLGLDE